MKKKIVILPCRTLGDRGKYMTWCHIQEQCNGLVTKLSWRTQTMQTHLKHHRVQPRKMATDLAIGQWAFLHALQVTRTHDVNCHCKTYVALFSTHLTEISTWILNDCTKTNEKFYLCSTQCIQGRKWKKICQVGSNKHENFTWFTM